MKKYSILLVLFASYNFLNAQNFETFYTKQYTSSNCGEEKFSFFFNNNILTKTDLYYNSNVKVPSKRVHTNFDSSSFYYEIWTPEFYLELYGINEYQKVEQYNYKVCFEKKGGDLLYIFESDANSEVETGKFYFTRLGRDIFCSK